MVYNVIEIYNSNDYINDNKPRWYEKQLYNYMTKLN
jgi:hypothetical protein